MKIPVKPKLLLYILFDAMAINVAFFFAYYFRFGITVFGLFFTGL